MELIFVRHGLPEHVVKHDGTPADPRLSPLGHVQAKAVAVWFNAAETAEIYTSTMNRARETAAPLEQAAGLQAEVRSGIAEFDRNSNSYVPMEELKRTDYDAWKNFMVDTGPRKEDPADFQRLVVATVGEIVEAHRSQQVAVVCHGGVINAYCSHVLARPAGDIFFCNVDYTSISRVMVASTGERSLQSLNETGHIRHLPHPRHA